ncbi:N-acetylmuramoyl-L-alanine amidase [Coralliovum pocilloporae]|uniref:N-acetylmuramoyl-L-alanine amidase n=1 Tax=Coralliovum pocilloporae TaxID=3066369 RepID=UPI00330776FE
MSVSVAEAQTAATGARIAGDDKRTRFVVDLTSEVPAQIKTLANPYRVVVDLPQLRFAIPVEESREGRGLIGSFRFGAFVLGSSRIVLDVKAPVLVEKSFVLPPTENQPARLVLDLVKTDRETFLKSVNDLRTVSVDGEPAPLTKADRLDTADIKPRTGKYLIVLDPGHGGIDTGAASSTGAVEKTVVLSFAKLLKEKLSESKYFDVMMTRESDVFVSLSQRVKFARDHKADLFLSIHADSVSQSYVRGASVYRLSERASDATAQELADQEALSEILAGIELDESTDEVADILIDLARRETRNFSIAFAQTLVGELKTTARLNKNPIRSAGFRVLRAHDIPSVLLELGYMSNNKDAKLLVSKGWKDRTADAVQNAITSFFGPRLLNAN